MKKTITKKMSPADALGGMITFEGSEVEYVPRAVGTKQISIASLVDALVANPQGLNLQPADGTILTYVKAKREIFASLARQMCGQDDSGLDAVRNSPAVQASLQGEVISYDELAIVVVLARVVRLKTP